MIARNKSIRKISLVDTSFAGLFFLFVFLRERERERERALLKKENFLKYFTNWKKRSKFSEGGPVWFTLWKNKKNFRESSLSTLRTKCNNIKSSFRNGVSFKNIAGKSNSLTEANLPTILSSFKRCKLQHR